MGPIADLWFGLGTMFEVGYIFCTFVRICYNCRDNFLCLQKKEYRRPKRLKLHDIKFKARICDDVFCDMLNFGRRIELVKLEIEGRRFEHFIDRHFSVTPFLIFDMECFNYAKKSAKDKISGKEVVDFCL